jgi:hypothetical protein
VATLALLEIGTLATDRIRQGRFGIGLQHPR